MKIEATGQAAIIPSEKIYYLDHVKVLLTMLVILHHACVAYGGPGGWYYKQPATDLKAQIPLDVLVSTNQSFFMGLFFLLSAYFIEPSLKRKGTKLYLIDRLKRLGIPLMFYSFILSPIINFLVYRYGMLHDVTFWQYLQGYHDWIDFGVLWFVAALLLFTLIFVGLYKLNLTGSKPITVLRGNYILLLGLGLGLITFLVRLQFPTDQALQPVGFHLGHFPQYIACFNIGIMASRGNLAKNLDLKLAKGFARLAGALLVTVFPLMFYIKTVTHTPASNFNGEWNIESLIYSFYEQMIGISIMVAITGISKFKLNRSTTFLSKLSRNTFAVYIFHPFVLVGISLILSRFWIAPTIKFAFAAPLAVMGSFVFAAGIMKVPGVNKVI